MKSLTVAAILASFLAATATAQDVQATQQEATACRVLSIEAWVLRERVTRGYSCRRDLCFDPEVRDLSTRMAHLE